MLPPLDDRDTSTLHIHRDDHSINDISTPIMTTSTSHAHIINTTNKTKTTKQTTTSSSPHDTILTSDTFTYRGDPAYVTLTIHAITIISGGGMVFYIHTHAAIHAQSPASAQAQSQ